MLARWRLFLTWMLMAAVPLQGFAAGTMLLCAAATHEVTIAAAHDGAEHDHFAPVRASADATKQGSSGGEASATGAKHQCNLCASCCHSVGLTDTPSIARTASVPLADLPDPIAVVANHLPAIPERPPRA